MAAATAAARSMRGTASASGLLCHHDDLLEAVVLLGEMLGVEWEDG